MRVDLFCESGEKYGLGHLRRCEHLFAHLQAIFPSLPFECQIHSDFSLSLEMLTQNLEIVIIDSYIAPKEFYDKIRCKLLICLDDFHRLIYPSDAIVLSPTLGSKSFGRRYGGERYVILNPIFYHPPFVSPQPNSILIALGGSKQNALIDALLESLEGEIQIINPYYKHPHYPIYSSPSAQEICTLLDRSEIVITSGGGGMNEALSRGKKIIALQIASNQNSQLKHAHSFPALFRIFSPQSHLSSKLKCALNKLRSLPSPPPKILGDRLDFLLYKLLLPLISPPCSLHFSLLSHAQKLQVLNLRNQEEVRQYSLNPSIISAKTHFQFISSLKFSQFFWAFFQSDHLEGEIIAVGSLQLLSPQKAVLGLYKNMKYRGIGDKILHSLIQSAKMLHLKILEIEVLKSNARALHLYQKYQFFPTKQTENTLILEKVL